MTRPHAAPNRDHIEGEEQPAPADWVIRPATRVEDFALTLTILAVLALTVAVLTVQVVRWFS